MGLSQIFQFGSANIRVNSKTSNVLIYFLHILFINPLPFDEKCIPSSPILFIFVASFEYIDLKSKQEIRFIINPISGIKTKDRIPGMIDHYIDLQRFNVTLAYTNHRGHGYELAQKAVKDGVDVVCAVGGDGSVHEIAKALINTKTVLAIVPAGSGNGIARYLGIPMKIASSIRLINDLHSISMDTGKINEELFIGFGGFGLDAVVAQKFDEDRRRGFITYAKHILREFFKYKSQLFEIEVDGKSYKKKAILFAVANTSEFGNGFVFSPNSNAHDGKLELVTIPPFSRWKLPGVVLKFYLGKTNKINGYESVSFEKLKLKTQRILCQIDGEPLQIEENLEVSVMPKSLNILTKKAP